MFNDDFVPGKTRLQINNMNSHVDASVSSCADPENFVGGSPNLAGFLLLFF